MERWSSHHPTHRPNREYLISDHRRYRLDFAWPDRKVAVEIQGRGPGHTSLEGMTKDYDKLMYALINGWRIVYLTKLHLSPGKFEEVLICMRKLLQISVRKGYIPIKERE